MGKRAKPVEGAVCDLMIRRIPRALRQAFHAKCKLLDIDMRDKVVYWIREWLGQEDRPREDRRRDDG